VASVTGDAPFLPLDLVDRLRAGLSGAPIAMASSAGQEHFTVALWAVSLRDDLRASLVERGERRVGAFLRRHGAAAVDWATDPVDPFLNVNTPEDLAVAEDRLKVS
jgi:molybdopterin-guanine dinucleotide biosynthesis protein A